MIKQKRNYLFLFLFVSAVSYSQNFSDICRTGTLNEIIQAINNNSDKEEKLKYDKAISKYTAELNNIQYLLDTLNGDSSGINTTNKNTSVYASELKKNQDLLNSLLLSRLPAGSHNYDEINPLFNNKNPDIRSLEPGKKTYNNESNRISKNVIDSLKFNQNLSADDKKKILQILSMR